MPGSQSLGGKYHLECKLGSHISTHFCLVYTSYTADLSDRLGMSAKMHCPPCAASSAVAFFVHALGANLQPLIPMKLSGPASSSPNPSRKNWASGLPSTLNFREKNPKDREKESRKEREEWEKEYKCFLKHKQAVWPMYIGTTPKFRKILFYEKHKQQYAFPPPLSTWTDNTFPNFLSLLMGYRTQEYNLLGEKSNWFVTYPLQGDILPPPHFSASSYPSSFQDSPCMHRLQMYQTIHFGQ